MAKRPGLVAIKTLFAHSCNRCAFPGCDERLTDPEWAGVNADIAHIRGEKPGAARYAPDMTDDERNAVDNLMLLCPKHHRVIDRLRPQDWPPERLLEVKVEHEERCGAVEWASEGLLEFYASSLVSMDAESTEATAPKDAPILVVEDGPGDTFLVVNIGNVDAFKVLVELAPGSAEGAIIRLETEPLERLSPGGRWRAGLHARTMGRRGPVIVRVRWKDADGADYDADFPL